MKICPYCKEQIPDDSKICPECNEKLSAANSVIKQIIICGLSIISVLVCFGCIGYEIISTNTLKEVQEVNSELKPIEYLQMIIKDEKALQNKLKNPQDKENNDKYFTIFYRNLLKYQRAFIDNTFYTEMPIERYFEIQGITIKNSGGTKMEFDSPKTYVIYYETEETQIGYGINYEYLVVKYGVYLSKAYKEFLNLSDYMKKAYIEDDINSYRMPYKYWSEFISKYPSFELIDIVKEYIETYSEYLKRY